MSTKNLVNMSLSNEQLAAVDAALETLESQLAGMISLSLPEKRRLRRMGDKSESFCRQTLNVIHQNPQLVPAKVSIDDAMGNLKLLDQLRPRLARMVRLCERASDTDIAVGHEIMTVALKSYGLMKLIGNGEGVETLRRDLASRFVRTKRTAAPAAPKAA